MKSILIGFFVFALTASLEATVGVFQHPGICANISTGHIIKICLQRDDVVANFETLEECELVAHNFTLSPDGCYQPVWTEDNFSGWKFLLLSI